MCICVSRKSRDFPNITPKSVTPVGESCSQKTFTGGVGATKDITESVTPVGAPQAVEAVSSEVSVALVFKKSDGITTILNLAAGTATITFSTNGISSTLSVLVNAG